MRAIVIALLVSACVSSHAKEAPPPHMTEIDVAHLHDAIMTMRAIQSDADAKKAATQAQADIDKSPFQSKAEAICKRYGFTLAELGKSWILDPDTGSLKHVETKAEPAKK